MSERDIHWTGGEMRVDATLLGGWRPVVAGESVTWDACPACESPSQQGMVGLPPVGEYKKYGYKHYKVTKCQGSAKIQCLSCGFMLSGEYRGVTWSDPPTFRWNWRIDDMPRVQPPRSRVSLLADDDPHPYDAHHRPSEVRD